MHRSSKPLAPVVVALLVAIGTVSGSQLFRDGEVSGDDLAGMLREAMLAGFQTLLAHYDDPPKE